MLGVLPVLVGVDVLVMGLVKSFLIIGIALFKGKVKLVLTRRQLLSFAIEFYIPLLIILIIMVNQKL
jgi:hypothetical protein